MKLTLNSLTKSRFQIPPEFKAHTHRVCGPCFVLSVVSLLRRLSPYCNCLAAIGAYFGPWLQKGRQQRKEFSEVTCQVRSLKLPFCGIEAQDGQVRLSGTPRPPRGVPSLGYARSSGPGTHI